MFHRLASYDIWQVSAVVGVGTLAAERVDATPLANRKAVGLRTDSGTVYVGPAGVTAASGYPISTTQVLLPLSALAEIWVIAAGGGLNLRVVEFA